MGGWKKKEDVPEGSCLLQAFLDEGGFLLPSEDGGDFFVALGTQG